MAVAVHKHNHSGQLGHRPGSCQGLPTSERAGGTAGCMAGLVYQEKSTLLGSRLGSLKGRLREHSAW